MAALEANQAYLALMHIRAMHPERADQLSDIADCIRNCANDRTQLMMDIRRMQMRYDDLQVQYETSFCQRIKRLFKPSIRRDLP